MSGEFIIIAFFFPRIALLGWYLFSQVPANAVPFIGDLFGSIFVPRILVLIYIYQNLGMENPWFVAYFIVTAIVYVLGYIRTMAYSSRSTSRRIR